MHDRPKSEQQIVERHAEGLLDDISRTVDELVADLERVRNLPQTQARSKRKEAARRKAIDDVRTIAIMAALKEKQFSSAVADVFSAFGHDRLLGLQDTKRYSGSSLHFKHSDRTPNEYFSIGLDDLYNAAESHIEAIKSWKDRLETSIKWIQHRSGTIRTATSGEYASLSQSLNEMGQVVQTANILNETKNAVSPDEPATARNQRAKHGSKAPNDRMAKLLDDLDFS